MRPFIRTIETLELDGGSPCLDFVNTVRSRFEHPLYEFILSPYDWLKWIYRVKLLNDPEMEQIKKYVIHNPAKAAIELKRIIEAREVLYQIFRVLANKKVPLSQHITLLNRELSRTLRYLKIEFTDDLKIKEKWDDKSFNLLYTLHPVLKSSYDLLLSDAFNHLKECRHCGWIYLDKSKNNSRRWCNMKTCGNTEKTKKYYDTHKPPASKRVSCSL
jgi:predicted RNA-binding Zn ribbon-like protein